MTMKNVQDLMAETFVIAVSLLIRHSGFVIRVSRSENNG